MVGVWPFKNVTVVCLVYMGSYVKQNLSAKILILLSLYGLVGAVKAEEVWLQEYEFQFFR